MERLGETLLIGALLLAPWIYGSVEDTVRYSLCGVLLLGSVLFSWPDLSDGRLPRGALAAVAFPVFAITQIAFRQTVAPFVSMEAAAVGFSMAVVWAAIDSRSASTSTNSGRRFAIALLLGCAAESGFAAFQWSTDQRSLFGRKGDFQTMPFGSYVNHNNFAGLVALGVPLAIAMAIGDLRRSGKLTPRGLGLMGTALALAIATFASGSRGGVIALTLGLFVLGGIATRLVRARVSRASWVGPMAVVGCVVVIALAVVPAFTRARLLSILDRGGSLEYRLDIAQAAGRAFLDRPLTGSGLGAFADSVTPFKKGHGDIRSERAEADLIEFTVEGGLALITIQLIFAWWVWISARAEMSQSRDRSGKWLRAGALSSCSVMLFHSFFDFGFRIPANALAFAVLLAIATAASARPEPKPRRLALAWLLLLLGGALACVFRSLGAAGERAALARTSPESRLSALQDLVDRHPYLDRSRRQRGLDWVALSYSKGRYEPTRLARARADFEAVLKARPQWGEAWADLAWVKYFQGHTPEAKEDMSTATRFDPTHVGIGIASAQLMAWSGDLPGALAQISRLRRSNPQWSRDSARTLAESWTKDAAILGSVP